MYQESGASLSPDLPEIGNPSYPKYSGVEWNEPLPPSGGQTWVVHVSFW